MRGGCSCGWSDEIASFETEKKKLLEWESEQEPEPEGCGCNTYDDFTCAEHQAYHEEMEE